MGQPSLLDREASVVEGTLSCHDWAVTTTIVSVAAKNKQKKKKNKSTASVLYIHQINGRLDDFCNLYVLDLNTLSKMDS